MTPKDVDLADLCEFTADTQPPIQRGGLRGGGLYRVGSADGTTMQRILENSAKASLIFSPPASWPDDLELWPTAAVALNTADQYAHVATLWAALKARIDEIRAFFAPRKGAAHGVWQQWLSDEHEAIDRYVTAELKAAALLGKYDGEQRRRAEAERHRLETEARAKVEAEQLQAALQADADGETDIAADLLDTPAMLAPIETVVSQTPIVAGVGMTSRWKAEVADLDRLIVAAAGEIQQKGRARIATSMLKADQAAINKAATAMKGNLERLAGTLGLTVWDESRPRRTHDYDRRDLRGVQFTLKDSILQRRGDMSEFKAGYPRPAFGGGWLETDVMNRPALLLPGVQFKTPPSQFMQTIQAELDRSLAALPAGAQGALVGIATAAGVNAAIVTRVGPGWDVAAWIGKSWGEPVVGGALVRKTW